MVIAGILDKIPTHVGRGVEFCERICYNKTMSKIIKNAVQCKKCGDIIESKSVHDFVTCTCGACSVDGGHEYLRRCGNLEDMVEKSIVEPDIKEGRGE